MSAVNSFGAKSTLTVGDADYEIYRLDKVPGSKRLPFSLKVLLENLLRTEDGANVTQKHIEALGNWDPTAEPDTEIQYTPARVIMQDFTGVPTSQRCVKPCLILGATLTRSTRLHRLNSLLTTR